MEGHNQAFAYFGGCRNDALQQHAHRGETDRRRWRTKAYRGVQRIAIALFVRGQVGRPGKGNDKGNVEGLVGYARVTSGAGAARGQLGGAKRAPSGRVPEASERKLWRHAETIAERFERDREKLLPLPPAPLEACEQRTTRVSSQALVRYETNDYSVQTEYGHRQVLVKAFVWEVVIGCSSEVIARHSRSYGREEMIFNPLHYLALLEQKTNALDQAAPLQGLHLPEELIELRRQMEVRLAKHGRASSCKCYVCWRRLRWPKCRPQPAKHCASPPYPSTR